MRGWNVIHENIHTKYSVFTAPDAHMHTSLSYILWAYNQQIRQKHRERETETETQRHRQTDTETGNQTRKGLSVSTDMFSQHVWKYRPLYHFLMWSCREFQTEGPDYGKARSAFILHLQTGSLRRPCWTRWNEDIERAGSGSSLVLFGNLTIYLLFYLCIFLASCIGCVSMQNKTVR